MTVMPLDDAELRRIIRDALARPNGVVFRRHALDQMADRGFDEQLVTRVLRRSIWDGCDPHRQGWTYRRRLGNRVVVVAIPDPPTPVIVVTVIDEDLE